MNSVERISLRRNVESNLTLERGYMCYRRNGVLTRRCIERPREVSHGATILFIGK